MKNLLFLLFAFLLFSSEKCEQSTADNMKYTADTYVKIRTTGCYGTCPIYEFTINGVGEANYEGKRFTAVEGAKTKTFSEKETGSLLSAFERSDYWSFKDEYTSPVTDLPSTFLTFSHDGKTKEIRLYTDVPEQLVGLSKLVKSFANSEGWVRAEEK